MILRTSIRMFWPFRTRSKRSDSRENVLRVADDVSDRGPAKYFHGRRLILSAIEVKCRQASAQAGGTTFLIQGVPGAGKTALLEECAKRALVAGWQIADIDPDALWDPEELHKSLNSRRTPRITKVFRQVRSPGLKIDADTNGPTTLDVLKRGKGKLFLVLDEA